MKEYTVYFEIYGKKMKTTVQAISRVQAENIVKSKLVIHEVKEEPEQSELAKLMGKSNEEVDRLLRFFKGGNY